MSLDYGSILSRAWQITWNHKILWVFGVLASLGGGGGSNSVNYSMSGGDFDRPGGGDLPPQIERFFERVDPTVLIAVVIGLVCLGILIGLTLLALSVIGRGGLIGGIQLAEANGKVTFGEAWGVGVRYFWTLFLIGLLVGVVTIVLALLTVLPGVLLTAATFGLGLLCLIPLICVFAIVAIALSILAYFAQISAVIENRGVTDALRRSWEIIRANVGPIIVLGLIVIVISALAGFILSLPMLLIVVPAAIGVVGFATESPRLGGGALILAGLCFVAYLPVLIVLGGVLQTWVTSAWTLAYQQFARPAPAAGSEAAPPPVPA